MIRRFVALALGLVAAATMTLAGALAADGIEIQTPWTRAVPPTSKVGAGYMTVVNTGTADDRLIAARSGIAARVEIHEMTMDAGVMRMRELKDGLAVAAGQSVELKPGGYHVMFMGLREPIKAGDVVDVTLVFEGAGEIAVKLRAAKIGAGAPPAHAGHGMHHGATKHHAKTADQ